MRVARALPPETVPAEGRPGLRRLGAGVGRAFLPGGFEQGARVGEAPLSNERFDECLARALVVPIRREQIAQDLLAGGGIPLLEENLREQPPDIPILGPLAGQRADAFLRFVETAGAG